MKTAETSTLINCLTEDRDERQELWVHYLEHNDISALPDHLSVIRKTWTEDQLLQVDIWRHFSIANNKYAYMQYEFTELEQSVMQLLAMGATVNQISSIKGIQSVRVRHIISVIREHPCWSFINGT